MFVHSRNLRADDGVRLEPTGVPKLVPEDCDLSTDILAQPQYQLVKPGLTFSQLFIGPVKSL